MAGRPSPARRAFYRNRRQCRRHQEQRNNQRLAFGDEGTATGILDQSGTLDLVENRGSISIIDAVTLGDKGVAIDLRANGGGATVSQLAAASGQPAPQIRGNILFGSGGDTLNVLAGTINGKIDFGGGADAMTLGGTGLFRGTLAGSAGLAVTSARMDA